MCYLVGVVCGCTYFSFKHEKTTSLADLDDEDEDPANLFDEEPRETNMIKDIFKNLQRSSGAAIIAIGLGLIVMQLLVAILSKVNSSP